MAAGTLTLTQNSTAVTGSGTAFTNELSVGDVIFVALSGINYTLVVSAIVSNTSLTVARAFLGNTTSGVSWVAVPQAVFMGIHAQLAADVAWARRAAITDKITWQQVFSSSGQIEVPLPDGSRFTGPSWLYMVSTMATKTDGAVPVNQGGTGATTAEDARASLGLVDSNGVVPVKLGGTGESSAPGASSTLNFYGNFASHFNNLNGDMDSLVGQSNTSGGETYSIAISTSENNVANWPTNPTNSGKAYGWGAMMCFTHARGGGRTQIYVPDDAANLYFRHRYGSAWKNWVAVWTNRNTTVDSNGFIKRASPIVSVFGDGSYDTNAESEGAMVQRTGTGEYKITGICGLNSDLAWGGINGGIEIPKDINGQPLIWVDYKVLEDGDMVIKTYHREHQNAPEFARNTIKGIADGEPVDIPSNTFVSVRVEMPKISAWHQRMAEAEKSMTETPGASAAQ